MVRILVPYLVVKQTVDALTMREHRVLYYSIHCVNSHQLAFDCICPSDVKSGSRATHRSSPDCIGLLAMLCPTFITVYNDFK